MNSSWIARRTKLCLGLACLSTILTALYLWHDVQIAQKRLDDCHWRRSLLTQSHVLAVTVQEGDFTGPPCFVDEEPPLLERMIIATTQLSIPISLISLLTDFVLYKRRDRFNDGSEEHASF